MCVAFQIGSAFTPVVARPLDVHVGPLMRTLTARCARGRRCPRASDRVCVRMKGLRRRSSGYSAMESQCIMQKTRPGCDSETGGVAARIRVRQATYCRPGELSSNGDDSGAGRSKSSQHAPTSDFYVCGAHAVVGALPTGGVIAASAAGARPVSVQRCPFGRQQDPLYPANGHV